MAKIKKVVSERVKDAHQWQYMEGCTPLEQMINAYLTCQFVISKNVPADECREEARKIIAIVRAYGTLGDTGAAWDELGRKKFPA